MLIKYSRHMGTATVSYTHLDVYKRQGRGRIDLPHAAAGLAAGTEGIGLERLPQGIEEDISGTGDTAAHHKHLGAGGGGDVYKRQP